MTRLGPLGPPPNARGWGAPGTGTPAELWAALEELHGCEWSVPETGAGGQPTLSNRICLTCDALWPCRTWALLQALRPQMERA